jgi:hypothetical protein
MGGEEIKLESSNQAMGMESSIVPFSKWTSDTQWHNPSTKDDPKDDYHNKIKNEVNLLGDLYKEFAFNKKEKK